MGNTTSSGSSKSRRSRHSSESATDRARKVVGDLQATLQSSVKKLEEQDHPAAQLIDSVCGQYFDDDSKFNGRHSRSASFYSEDISEDDSRTISEDETTLDTDYRHSSKSSTNKKGDQSVESSSYQSDYASEMSREAQRNGSTSKKKARSGNGGREDEGSLESEEESSYTPKGVVTETNLDVGPGQLNKPLASSFAKRCYFTKSGIGKTTQHYEGLTLTGNVVLMLAAAMKLKGCPTICDEDLRRVEQTYPNQFSRLPDELLLSSGWRRISKYCHFSNKPIPDGIPFFHSKQRLHPSGGYFFLLAASVGMVRPIDVEPLNRDTLVLLETDFPTQCDAAPPVLIKEPDQWTLVDKFCFFSGGPINTDEDVYYQADFDGNPIYMLAFLSPSLTPEELYKLDSDKQGEPGLKSVAAVEEVESVYDLTERDFHDLKLYHLGPCRALPQYILQPQAWTKVLPPHFLSARQRAVLKAQEHEARHGVPQVTLPANVESHVDPGHQLTVGATPIDPHMPEMGNDSEQHYPDNQNYYMSTPNHEQQQQQQQQQHQQQQQQQQLLYEQQHQTIYGQPPHQQPMYDQSQQQPIYDQSHQQPMFEQPPHQQAVYEAYNTPDSPYPVGGAYPTQPPDPYLPQGIPPSPYHFNNESHHIHQQLQQQLQQQPQQDDSGDKLVQTDFQGEIEYQTEATYQLDANYRPKTNFQPEDFQRQVEEEGAFVDSNVPLDEAMATHVSRTNTANSTQLGIRNDSSGGKENHNTGKESHNGGTPEIHSNSMVENHNTSAESSVVESHNSGAVESHSHEGAADVENCNKGIAESNNVSNLSESQNGGSLAEASKGSNLGESYHGVGLVDSHNDSGLVECHIGSNSVDIHNSGIEDVNSIGHVESHNSAGLVESHNTVGLSENLNESARDSLPDTPGSNAHSEEGGVSVDQEVNYSYHGDDLEAQTTESHEEQDTMYTDEDYSKMADTPQAHDFVPRDEEQYYDSPEQQDGQHEFFGTPSVEQDETTFSPNVDDFAEDEFGRNENDYDDNVPGEDSYDRSPYKEHDYSVNDFDRESYDDDEFGRRDYGEDYYVSPEKTISDADSADYSREMEQTNMTNSSPIRMDHLRRLGRKSASPPPKYNETSPPMHDEISPPMHHGTSPPMHHADSPPMHNGSSPTMHHANTPPPRHRQSVSPTSEYSHTSAMRGAHELLRRNRLRRQERARRQTLEEDQSIEEAPSPVVDEFDQVQPDPSPSPQSQSQSRTEEESGGAWESGSELTSVISGSSVWTDSSNPTDRSSRRALILQMAKARMKSNKEREDKINAPIAEEYSLSVSENDNRGLAEAGGPTDLDFSADLD